VESTERVHTKVWVSNSVGSSLLYYLGPFWETRWRTVGRRGKYGTSSHKSMGE